MLLWSWNSVKVIKTDMPVQHSTREMIIQILKDFSLLKILKKTANSKVIKDSQKNSQQ